MLQILVNHYMEDGDTVKRFLSSLAMQTEVEFEVMLLSDGGMRLSQEDISGYPFRLEYAYKPHTGVCDTRNVMLDRATAEFVLFADVDDFFSDDGLRLLMAKTAGMDVVGSTYLSEGPNGETHPMERDVIRLHAKIFRRQYLVDNEIRFPDMEFSGDMAFLWLAYSLTKRIAWVDEPFYTWSYNVNSVTRGKPYHHVRAYGVTLECYRRLAHELTRRERPDLLMNLIATLFGMMYVDVTSERWRTYPDDLRAKAEDEIEGCVREFSDVWMGIPGEYRREKFALMRDFVGQECGGYLGMDPWVRGIIGDRDVLIVGHGVVGTNLGNELAVLKPRFCDKYKGERASGHFRFAFICVDTPYTEDGPL